MTDLGGGVIVGVGETALGSFPGRTALDLQAEAVQLALGDAGLGKHDVDGLFNLGPYSRPARMFGMSLAEYLGIRPAVVASIDAGGTLSPIMMLANAAWSVASGLCSVAVCTFGEATASGRVQPGRGWTTTAEALEFEEPFGLVGPVTSYALLTARHMADFGTTEEDLYAVAASARRHAARNPLAVRRTPFTFEEYRASRVIATPLRLYDCSSIVDGAGAVVVTTGARAADLPHDPVALLGVGSQMSHRDVGRFPDWDALEIGAATDRAFRAAGIGLADIDVAFITDGFTISTLVFLEEVGFCGRGEGGAYIRDGNLDLGSHCPVNTHGGLLSQGHVAGMLHVTEAIKQLRGKEGERQVDGAELALVTGGGAMFGLSAAMVLGRSDR